MSSGWGVYQKTVTKVGGCRVIDATMTVGAEFVCCSCLYRQPVKRISEFVILACTDSQLREEVSVILACTDSQLTREVSLLFLPVQPVERRSEC